MDGWLEGYEGRDRGGGDLAVVWWCGGVERRRVVSWVLPCTGSKCGILLLLLLTAGIIHGSVEAICGLTTSRVQGMLVCRGL